MGVFRLKTPDWAGFGLFGRLFGYQGGFSADLKRAGAVLSQFYKPSM